MTLNQHLTYLVLCVYFLLSPLLELKIQNNQDVSMFSSLFYSQCLVKSGSQIFVSKCFLLSNKQTAIVL